MTGRGRPASVVRTARCSCSGMREARWTSTAHFVIGWKRPTRSISSNASRWAMSSPTCPTTASTGTDSAYA